MSLDMCNIDNWCNNVLLRFLPKVTSIQLLSDVHSKSKPYLSSNVHSKKHWKRIHCYLLISMWLKKILKYFGCTTYWCQVRWLLRREFWEFGLLIVFMYVKLLGRNMTADALKCMKIKDNNNNPCHSCYCTWIKYYRINDLKFCLYMAC